MPSKKSSEIRAKCLANLHHNAEPRTYQFAQDLRKRTTEAEQKLWALLRNRLLNGRKFRRQHALGPYVADFYCHECKLVIELDGAVHTSSEAKQYDQERTRAINEMGITVIRFWNKEIIDDPSKVLQKIAKYLQYTYASAPAQISKPMHQPNPYRSILKRWHRNRLHRFILK